MKLYKYICFIIFFIFVLSNLVFADGVISDKFLFDSYSNSYSEPVNKAAQALQKHDYKNAENQLYYAKSHTEYDIFKGEIELHNNNLDLAEVHFKKALTSYKGYSNDNIYLVNNELAKLYFLKKDYKKALEYSDNALKSKYFEKEFIETRVQILSEIKNHKQKTIVVNKDILSEVQEIPVLANIQMIDSTNDWSVILNYVTNIDNIIKENETITWGEAFGFTKQQRSNALIKYDTYVNTLILKSKLVYTLGYSEDAQDIAKQALDYHFCNATNDTKVEAFRINALVQKNPKNYNQAISWLTQALEINPTDSRLYFSRSYYCNELQKYDEAIDDIDKYIELEPNDYLGYEQKGRYLKGMQKYDEALKMFNKAISLNPNAKDAIEIKKETIAKIEYEKIPYAERETKRQLKHTEILVNLLKSGGLLKRVQKQNDIMVYYVDANAWYDGGSSGRVTTLEIIDDYSILRGCKISDFKDYKTGQLLFRYRTRVRDLPTINTGGF